jgi:hypothetical protein
VVSIKSGAAGGSAVMECSSPFEPFMILSDGGVVS